MEFLCGADETGVARRVDKDNGGKHSLHEFMLYGISGVVTNVAF